MYNAAGDQIRPTAVTWTSDDRSIATIDDDIRILNTHAPGAATIYCETFDRKVRSNSIKVEVVDISAIRLDPPAVEVPVGSRRRIVATCRLSSGEDASDVALMSLPNDSTIAR